MLVKTFVDSNILIYAHDADGAVTPATVVRASEIGVARIEIVDPFR
jgi:predicted nucleic acid-binding protein